MDNKIYSNILKFLSGSASSQEREELFNWLKESRENRIHYFKIKKIWIESDFPGNEETLDQSWERLKLRTIHATPPASKKNKSVITFRKLLLAATVVILLGITVLMGIELRSIAKFDQTVHEITVPRGARTNLILPDGTTVWLNAGSTLKYKANFGRQNRDVTLEGEAFFDVTPDPGHVFRVNTNDMKIRVLGTQLNVKSYPGDISSQATLIKGEVEVSVIHESRIHHPVKLTPNQKAVYPRDSDTLFIEQVKDAYEQSLWKEGKLVFRSETLANIARELERFYNVEIVFKDDSARDIKFSGIIEEVAIENVMRAIASVSSISYEIKENRVLISN